MIESLLPGPMLWIAFSSMTRSISPSLLLNYPRLCFLSCHRALQHSPLYIGYPMECAVLQRLHCLFVLVGSKQRSCAARCQCWKPHNQLADALAKLSRAFSSVVLCSGWHQLGDSASASCVVPASSQHRCVIVLCVCARGRVCLYACAS